MDGCGQPSPKEAFSPSRLPYPTSPAALSGAASMYQQALNYSLYSRGYPLYPPHPLAARSLQRPFMSGQLEPYPQFIPSVPFTPPGQPGLTPQQLPSLPPAPTVVPPTSMPNQNGVKMNHHGMEPRGMPPNVPPHQLPQMQMHKEPKSKDKSLNQVNLNNNHHHNLNNNTDSLGFKVPSGKEGSMKHRILTRPYDKDAKQRSPTSGANGGSISFAR